MNVAEQKISSYIIDNKSKLINYCYFITKVKEISLDIYQDTYIKALKFINRLNDSNIFEPFLFAVLKYSSWKYLKERNRKVSYEYIENLKNYSYNECF